MKNLILTFFVSVLILISQNLYAQINLDSGCVANYPFNGNAIDISGNGNNGVINGATLTTNRFGQNDSAYYFNGVSSTITVPITYNIPVGNSPYSIAVWIFLENIGVRGIIGWGSFGLNNSVTAIRIGPHATTGSIHHFWWCNDLITNMNDSLVGQWYFLVCQFDGSTRKTYINSQLISSDHPSGHSVPNSLNFIIGATLEPGVAIRYFKGKIDDIRVYNRALSQPEIIYLYYLDPLSPPVLLSPANGSTGVSLTPTLFWDTVSNATAYTVQVSPLSNFSLIVDSATVTTNQRTIPAGKLNVASTYFWRVRGINSFGNGPWSDVWNFSTILTNIQKLSSEIPRKFKLYSNHPNPFNPVTNIKFDLPKSSFINISVYNILGEEVNVIVNDNLSAGSYKIIWNASSFTSGVYFCKLITGDFVDVKRMVLLK